MKDRLAAPDGLFECMFGRDQVSIPVPLEGVRQGDPKTLQQAADDHIRHFIEALRAVVENGHRRCDDGTGCSGKIHEADVAAVQRRFAQGEDQRAAFFQAHVCGAGDEIVGVSVGNLRKGFDRARQDEHALSVKRSGGDWGSNIARLVDDISEGFNILDFPVGLLGNGQAGGSTDDEVGFHCCLAQHLQSADAEDGAGGAGDGEDDLGFCGLFLQGGRLLLSLCLESTIYVGNCV